MSLASGHHYVDDDGWYINHMIKDIMIDTHVMFMMLLRTMDCGVLLTLFIRVVPNGKHTNASEKKRI